MSLVLLIGTVCAILFVFCSAYQMGFRNGRGSDGGEAEPEQFVLGLFRGDSTSEEDRRSIISALPGLNWSTYNKTYNKVSGQGAMELLTWLYTHPADNAADIACILKSTAGLDGAYAEQYTNVVGRMCSSNPQEFVRALSTLAEDRVDRICSFVGFYSTENDMAATQDQLGRLADSSGLSTRDKALAERLIKAME